MRLDRDLGNVLRNFLLILLFAGRLSATPAGSSVSASDTFNSEAKPVIGEFCLKCHGANRPKAGVNLSLFTNTISVYRDPRLWEKVASKLDNGEMPPEGKPQ